MPAVRPLAKRLPSGKVPGLVRRRGSAPSPGAGGGGGSGGQGAEGEQIKLCRERVGGGRGRGEVAVGAGHRLAGAVVGAVGGQAGHAGGLAGERGRDGAAGGGGGPVVRGGLVVGDRVTEQRWCGRGQSHGHVGVRRHLEAEGGGGEDTFVVTHRPAGEESVRTGGGVLPDGGRQTNLPGGAGGERALVGAHVLDGDEVPPLADIAGGGRSADHGTAARTSWTSPPSCSGSG
jgi:hypothetical protein